MERNYTIKAHAVARPKKVSFRDYDPGSVFELHNSGITRLVLVGREDVMFIAPDGKLTWSSIKPLVEGEVREVKVITITIE